MEVKKEMEREKSQSRNSGKIFLVKLSTIISSIFLTITALGLAYVAGVMSGRHHILAEGQQELIQPINQKTQAGQGEGILAPEDLEFARVLKGQSPKKPVASIQLSQEATSGNEAMTEKGEEIQPDEKQQLQPVASPAIHDELFDFLYQVAAFKDETSADNLRQKLEGFGYRTMLQKNGNLVVILVKMRATENGANEFLDVTRQMRLGTPLLKNRSPVSR